MNPFFRFLLAICVVIGFATLAACESGDGGGSDPAVDVSKITCGTGTLASFDECVAYGQCYGKMCADQNEGAALDACVGTGGELAIGAQLGPACNNGDEAAIRLACEAGTAQLVAGGAECTLPGGETDAAGTEDVAATQDVAAAKDAAEVDLSGCEGPCENHMEGQCLGTDYGCRCEYVDNGFGQSELKWVLSNCVEGAYADMCRNDLGGTPLCKPNAEGTSAACECDM